MPFSGAPSVKLVTAEATSSDAIGWKWAVVSRIRSPSVPD